MTRKQSIALGVAAVAMSFLSPAQAQAQAQHGHGSHDAAPAGLPPICTAHATQAGHDGHAGHGEAAAPASPSAPGPGQAEMMRAMDAMHRDMGPTLSAPDMDVAFVCGMIPHHEAAIGMARAQLEHGRDEWVKSVARAVIEAQEREIREMREWLEKRG